MKLWRIPPKSPDLNPIEKFWAWLRKHLRKLDLEDLQRKWAPLTKPAYRVRVRSVLRTKKAQSVASSCALGLRKVCQEVVQKKGAASRT